ncbi:MAG: hypothetical protein Q7U04_10420 [Bacteriovorax sp.]|nr:hypothetical protein [Bacteriovorax sp.]
MSSGVLVILLVVAGCSHSISSKSYSEEVVGRTVGNEAAKIAMLTENTKVSLSSVIKKARENGTIDEVIVLSWADRNYLFEDLKKLSTNSDPIEYSSKASRSVVLDKLSNWLEEIRFFSGQFFDYSIRI